MIKYLHGKENYSSSFRKADTVKADDQHFKFLHFNDNSLQTSLSGCKVLAVQENCEVVKNTVKDEKANAVKWTKGLFSMYCRNAAVCSKYDGINCRKAFDPTVYSLCVSFKSLQKWKRSDSSKRMEDVIEAVECKATVDGIEFILLCQ